MTPPKETRHSEVESRLTDTELDEVVGGIASIPPPPDQPDPEDPDTNNKL
jgi:hypothetical protein